MSDLKNLPANPELLWNLELGFSEKSDLCRIVYITVVPPTTIF